MTQTLNGTPGNDILTGTDPGAPSNPDGIDIINGLDGNDLLDGGGGADVLDGGAGIDTASYAASATGVTVDLPSGQGVGGDAEGDLLQNIENLIGSAFADILRGTAAANALSGGAGDDQIAGYGGADAIDGGAGVDTVNYDASVVGVFVNLTAGRGSGGDATGDTLSNVENLAGSAFADLLVGSGGANALTGGDGDDELTGLGGADALNGGNGIDAVHYNASAAAVRVDLASGTGTGTGGDAQGDTFVSIENVLGSAFNDRLFGDAGANQLAGGDGDDVLHGGAGADTLIGNAGSDKAGHPYLGWANFYGTRDPIDEAFGWINAIDPTLGSVAWRVRVSSLPLGAVVATAGGLVVTGTIDGTLMVLDAQTGEEISRMNLGGAIGGGIITYEAGGKQFIAVAAGDNNATYQTKGQNTVVVLGLP